jgi:hypothetical protein
MCASARRDDMAAGATSKHNVILFVAGGLRRGVIDAGHAPVLLRLRQEGVDFGNSHALFPTLTMPNAAAIATGHQPGDTGVYGDIRPSADRILAGDAGSTDLAATSLLAVAREQGFSTASIGRVGAAAVQDVVAGAEASPPRTVFIDDATDSVNADAMIRSVLPTFKGRGKPFLIVFWSRDPEGAQQTQGDSLNLPQPGINGPTSQAAVWNADANLGQILGAVDADPRLRDTTDIFVTSDHGASTISKHEIDAHGKGAGGYATKFEYRGANGGLEVPVGWLPPGFVAIDLARALDLPLFDPDRRIEVDGSARYLPVDPAQPSTPARAQHPAEGNGLIGGSGGVLAATDAKVIVTANGGSDLIYVPGHDEALVRRIVAALAQQDYTGALLVDPAFGDVAGGLPMDVIGLIGSAPGPRPAVVVTFKTFAAEPKSAAPTAVEIADSALREGQGTEGGGGRDDALNNMAAVGPDFKRGFVDPTPVGNADVAPTLARVLGLSMAAGAGPAGRVLEEALVGGANRIASERRRRISTPDPGSGKVTVLEYQIVDGRRYVDRVCLVPFAHDLDFADRAPCD